VRRRPLARSISNVVAARAMSEMGCRTVVSSGQIERARCVSSKPQTVKSAGTSRWRLCATEMAAGRHVVIAGENSGGRIGQFQQRLAGDQAGTVSEEAWCNERFVTLDASIGER